MSSTQLTAQDVQYMDKQDEDQIINIDSIKHKLVYDVKGNKTLSLVGIKLLSNIYCKDNNVSTRYIRHETILEKEDEENRQQWFWRSEVVMLATRNVMYMLNGKELIQKIETEVHGIAQSTYNNYEGGTDQFAKTKASSKAERNAWRKLIPELDMGNLIQDVPEDKIQYLKSSSQNTTTTVPSDIKTCTCSPQTRVMDVDEKTCTTCKKEFSIYVRNCLLQIKNKLDDPDKYCSCEKFIPNSISNGKTCQSCKKLAPKEIVA